MIAAVILTMLLLIGWYAYERRARSSRPVSPGRQAQQVPYSDTWELYHNDLSLCSKKTRICLAELGIEYRSHHVDLIETGSYENISRAHLRLNPAGTVPVLVHEGHPIYESHEQILYAAEHSAPGFSLIPADPIEREIMATWVHMTSLLGDDPIAGLKETMGNAVPGLTVPLFAAMIADIPYRHIVQGLLFHPHRIRPLLFIHLKRIGLRGLSADSRLVRLIGRSRDALHQHLDVLEHALATSGGPWIVGAQFSLADVGMMAILERLREADWLDEFLLDSRPLVRQYWHAMVTRPSYGAELEKHRHPTVERGFARLVEEKSTNPALRAALHGS